MALNLTNLFTALGRIGRTAYIINGQQSLQSAPLDSLVGYAYLQPEWLTGLVSSYDSVIRAQTSGMGVWSQQAAIILQNLVLGDNPTYGQSLPTSLFYLNQQMLAQGASVQSCTIGQTTTPDAQNVGSGSLVVVLTRADGILYQNVVAESGTLLITADSYTGGATAGQEPWSYIGEANISSLLTGVPVGLWDWDWPQGSGVSVSGNCIAADSYAATNANLLTNGDWVTWTGSPVSPSYWNLVVGTWGTTIQRSSSGMTSGSYCVQFIAGATLNELTQTFNSTSASGTDAGTTADVTAFSSYVFNCYLKATGVISAGVLTAKLVDGSGTTINDQAGTPNSTTVNLAGLSSVNWTAFTATFRLPVIKPSTVRLDIKITTALAGADLLMDWNALAPPNYIYTGGPGLVLFSRPDDLFEAAPDPDAYTIAFTNDRGGATYGATWQTLISRLFQTPGLILPYSGTPTILDTLITAP